MDNAFRYLETVAGDDSEAYYPYRAEVSQVDLLHLLISMTLIIVCCYSSTRMGSVVTLLPMLLLGIRATETFPVVMRALCKRQ